MKKRRVSIDDLISTATAAKELDLSVRTIQRYCRMGDIPICKFGRQIRIERRAFDEFKARYIRIGY